MRNSGVGGGILLLVSALAGGSGTGLDPGPAEVAGSPRDSARIPTAQGSGSVLVGNASSLLPGDSLFPGWVQIAFGGDRGATRYRTGEVEGRLCLGAEARGAGSGLLHPFLGGPSSTGGAAPARFDRIRWSWWVSGPVEGGDLTRKAGDDFAARVYLNFRFRSDRAGLLRRLKQRLANRRFGGEAPGRSVVYVWGNRAPEGTEAFSAYTDEAALVVVRSGSGDAARWWEEERDYREDFRRAFGEDPPPLHSVAIMTDADDTGASATACYGDIFLYASDRF